MLFNRGLNVINKLRPFGINFGKDLLVYPKLRRVALQLFPKQNGFFIEGLPPTQAPPY